ncbi:MAG: molybdopterin oxidoreductase [Flavobacteriales bacterium]|nr:MAG: molybdopterin oxidoreductase [Flavobacteriales bacterium]
MADNKKYWGSLEQLHEEPEFIAQAEKEFPEHIPVDEFLSKTDLDSSSTSRRDFLKFLGFSTAAATLVACETPVMKAIPYVNKPESITPGVATYYASTYYDGVDFCPILVKTREGRPIHIEGNKLSAITKGGVSARVNSSVLSLYDSNRLKGPMAGGVASDWDTVDKEITAKLNEISGRGGNIRILSNTIISPSTLMVIEDVKKKFGGQEQTDDSDTETNASVKHVTYDASSYSGIRKANKASFGKAIIPDYKFNKAKTIVSIGADFLVNWISSIEYALQYAETRNPKGKWMSKHYQFETVLSVTGSNADVRAAIKPSEEGKVAVALYNAIAGTSLSGGDLGDENNLKAKVERAASDLKKSKGKSLVVAGSNDKHVQTVVNAINDKLENYENTIHLDVPQEIRKGDDEAVAELINEMNDGKVDALLIYGANPAYTMPAGWSFADALNKVKLKISFAGTMNETASLCDYVCPDHHYLEAWNDANPKKGFYALTQPTIRPLFKTRQVASSLLKWAGMDSDYYKYIKGIWEEWGFPNQQKYATFTDYWNNCLHNGCFEVDVHSYPKPEGTADESSEEENGFKGDIASAASAIAGVSGGNWELKLYAKTGIGEGNQANNPWLQELPDPVTKVVWDNYITMNPADMKEGGYETHTGQQDEANQAKVTVSGISQTLPVVAVPGQRKGTIGIALGYGTAKYGEQIIGKNVFPWVAFEHGTLHYHAHDVQVEKADQSYIIATTQTHHTMMGRKIVNETTADIYNSKPKEKWNKEAYVVDAYGKKKPKITDHNLWDDHNITKGHRWGMSIDLNSCIGCGACITGCHSENNVPVVGKDEVRRNRDMHWLRLDRYYSSDTNKEENSYREMEVADDYPEVVFQPVMCQHCNHAPCETVCPVAATTHSEEGLNQMAYNRCVGTRYCANNCPYKVRRFNWFSYNRDSKFTDVNPSQDDWGRMVLNPDVVVRSRGVMEKCSLCVQRIQAGKLEAKKAGKPVEDGAIQTACSAACPTNAITFGDHNNESTQVNKNSQDERAYHLLEEVGVQPNIWYMTKVRNKSSEESNA